MPSCCSRFQCAADQQFNQERVARELKDYRKRGPAPTTRLLADGVAQAGESSGTVLDIGCGTGALALALLERGATRAIAVDASSAYIDAARDEAARRGLAEAIRFVHADFVQAAPHLESAAIVALDRVVCCYPWCEQLLSAAIRHAGRCLALSYPRDVWYVRLGVVLENGQRWLARNGFRTFVHPVTTIEDTITRAGFRLASRRDTWMWSADIYVRH